MTQDYTALVERAARAICDSDGVDADGEIYDAENGLIIDPAWRYYESAGRAVASVVSDAIASLERQLAEVRGERDEALADSRLFARVRKKQSDHDTELIEGFKAEIDRLAARCGELERALRAALPLIEEVAAKHGLSYSEAGGIDEDIRAALQEPQI